MQNCNTLHDVEYAHFAYDAYLTFSAHFDLEHTADWMVLRMQLRIWSCCNIKTATGAHYT